MGGPSLLCPLSPPRMIRNRAAAWLQPGRAPQHHVPRGTWCCYSSISAAACEKHLLSTMAEQRRIHGGCVSTLRARSRVPNEIFDQIGYLFVYSFREDTATECRSLTARCVDRSICSEAEPAPFHVGIDKHPSVLVPSTLRTSRDRE